MYMIHNVDNVLAFGFSGGWEWIVILIVAVLIFGRRLPEIARGVGKSLTEFKKGVNEAKNEVESEVERASEPDPDPTDEEILRPSPDEQ